MGPLKEMFYNHESREEDLYESICSDLQHILLSEKIRAKCKESYIVCFHISFLKSIYLIMQKKLFICAQEIQAG